jgi:MSHA biogenesis protein MshM
MYLEHFGLTEPPFRITPHTDFFFAGANRGATLDALIYAVTHDEGIIKISGEVGSGKTMLCRVLIERLPPEVAIVYLANPSLSRDDILYAIADELRIALPENARPSVVLRSLQGHLIRLYGEGRRVVVLIDEAHAMPAATLEEIRLLSNLESNHSKLLQLVLFGQPELNEILARADMRQLKERITHNFPLEPLVRDDIAEYMEFRMRAAGFRGPNVFSPSATKLIASSSQGLTRRINMLADKALLAAFSENTHQIVAKHVRAAIKDCDFSKATGAKPRLPPPTSALLAALALAAAGGLVLGNMSSPGEAEVPSPMKVRKITPPPPVPTPAPTTPVPAAPVATIAPPVVVPPSSAPTPLPAATPIPTAPAVPGSAPASVVTAPPPAPTPIPKFGVGHYLDAYKTWLSSADNHHWFIQLATETNHADAVDAYLRTVEKSGVDMTNVRVYLSDLSGTLRYGVIYGDFPTRGAATNAIHDLPAKVKERHPYPRPVVRFR